MKRKFWVVPLLSAALACASAALGAGPLGPPTTTLKKGQFGIAAEYARSEADWQVRYSGSKTDLDNIRSDTFLVQLGYGATDYWELYVPLGMASLEDEDSFYSYEFAYGLGTRLTFEKNDTCAWGLLFELGWRNSNDHGTLDLSEIGITGGDIQVKYHDLIVALGPTWQIAEGLRLYGGPFFYALEGNIDVENGSSDASLDLSTESLVGGYVGIELDICPTSSWYGEFQFTSDIMVFGTGIGWKF